MIEGFSGPQAGVFRVLAPALDLGAFALVGADSGVVITAGGIH